MAIFSASYKNSCIVNKYVDEPSVRGLNGNFFPELHFPYLVEMRVRPES